MLPPSPLPRQQVKASLQGQRIPAHLVSQHPNPPSLDLTFAAQPDLQIKTQSYCTRWVGGVTEWVERAEGSLVGMALLLALAA